MQTMIKIQAVYDSAEMLELKNNVHQHKTHIHAMPCHVMSCHAMPHLIMAARHFNQLYFSSTTFTSSSSSFCYNFFTFILFCNISFLMNQAMSGRCEYCFVVNCNIIVFSLLLIMYLPYRYELFYSTVYIPILAQIRIGRFKYTKSRNFPLFQKQKEFSLFYL